MTYKYAVTRNGLLLDRALTHAGAIKRAAIYTGAIAIAFVFVTGCANPKHGGTAVPCDSDNCGKNPGGK